MLLFKWEAYKKIRPTEWNFIWSNMVFYGMFLQCMKISRNLTIMTVTVTFHMIGKCNFIFSRSVPLLTYTPCSTRWSSRSTHCDWMYQIPREKKEDQHSSGNWCQVQWLWSLPTGGWESTKGQSYSSQTYEWCWRN